jgi:NTP pyrophosphatase (non-canonical NTP hydrolase)
MTELQFLQKENLDHYGVQVQLRKLQEECGELIAAINHFFDRKINQDILISEMADVENVLDSMRIYFGDEMIDIFKIQKMTRQRDRIKVETFNAGIADEKCL